MAGGRPSKFPEGQESAIKKLVLMGASDEDLAEAYNVTFQTVNNWKKDRPSFFESLKGWKEEADTAVERSLYQRACGYQTTEIRTAVHEGMITDVQSVPKHFPPDTTACIFWLKNRQPNNWRDKREVDLSGEVGILEINLGGDSENPEDS